MAKRIIKISLSLVTLMLLLGTSSCGNGNGLSSIVGVSSIEETFNYANGVNLSETDDWETLPDTL